MTSGLLVVSGIRHVMAVLEEIENGLLEDVTALIEAYACEGGCFGSPLLFEDHHVAQRRWNRGDARVERRGGRRPRTSRAATAGGRPYAARPGIRLDADMGQAIQKLGRLQAITRSLPGRDCGACGAPTCAALAEDVVMERAGIELCPYVACEKEDAGLMRLHELAEALDLTELTPAGGWRGRDHPRLSRPTCSATSWPTPRRAGCW